LAGESKQRARSDPDGPELITSGRNDRCPSGSGKKYGIAFYA